MYVCLCKGLTESDVQKVAHEVRGDKHALIMALGLDDKDCCGRCARNGCSLAKMCSTAPSCTTDSEELLSTP